MYNYLGMNTLHYIFTCLDGFYDLNLRFDNMTVKVDVNTNIDGLYNREDILDSQLFIEELNKAKLNTWQKSYDAYSLPIEDATAWSLICNIDGCVYISKGVESYEPMYYDQLIKAFMVLDPKAEYLLFKTED